MPGTVPRTVRATLEMWSPPSVEKETTAEVSSRSGALPALARAPDSAMLKQEACAAASSSSGLVMPPGSSDRAAHVTFTGSMTPEESKLVMPCPDLRSPSQTLVALRSVIAQSFTLVRTGQRSVTPGGRRGNPLPGTLDVEVVHVHRVGLDPLPPVGRRFAHEQGEDRV